MSLTPADAERRAELKAALDAVRARIAAAAERAGRAPGDVTLIAVTKFFPAADVAALVDLGVSDIGENRAQEAAAKVAELRTAGVGPRVHFIGHLQSNKAGLVAALADVVHSVDRLALVAALDRAALAAGRRLDVLLQVGLDRSGQRSGADPGDIPALADAVAATRGLRLAGVMGVAPLGGDPAAAYAVLRGIADQVTAVHPQARWLSAGMSGDLEEAIAAGATHVRVGSAILGSRRGAG